MRFGSWHDTTSSLGVGRRARTVLVCMLCCAAPLRAQSADSAAVVKASETLLRAISTKDTALARTVLLPGAVFYAVLDPTPPTASVQPQTDVQFYASLASYAGTFLERAWSPEVHFSGTALAQVTARYDFHINGKFSHCGTDVFTLMKTGGGWRIASTTYTVQRQGCAPSPLGPPSR